MSPGLSLGGSPGGEFQTPGQAGTPSPGSSGGNIGGGGGGFGGGGFGGGY